MIIFELSNKQENMIKDWDHNHDCSYKEKFGVKKYSGAVGGRLQYIFIPTSIGDIAKVKCECGAELDLTEGL